MFTKKRNKDTSRSTQRIVDTEECDRGAFEMLKFHSMFGDKGFRSQDPVIIMMVWKSLRSLVDRNGRINNQERSNDE